MERPIIFNSEEIKAILQNRKKEFIEVIKPQPPAGVSFQGWITCSTHKEDEGKAFWSDKFPLSVITHQEWIAWHFPLKIYIKPPKCPGEICPDCHEVANKLTAVNTGEGWIFDWDCENGCGALEYEGVRYPNGKYWWPFLFGAVCNSDDLDKHGIEVV